VTAVDPKQISIKTMKLVVSIDGRLARIEAALGIGDQVGQSELPQMHNGEAVAVATPPPPEPPGKAKHRG
jgi:hypothetical protein